jgi:phosphonoacetate hydrolase
MLGLREDFHLREPVESNGRTYKWPSTTVAVICFDGCDPEYIDAARDAGAIPNIVRMIETGYYGLALAVMPTFTNPNNVSIVCGAAPAVTGVSGNFYLDRETGEEVMMLDATPMRADTLLAAFATAGASVVAITAKDKLRKALGKNLEGIAFSAEKADQCTLAENGISDVLGLVGRGLPDQYSANLSLFVLDAGIALMKERKPDLMYLSLSDYVQHAHAPEEEDALDFMREVDSRIGELLELGAIVGIVADHGMTDMAQPDGRPNVLYVGDLLDETFGAGRTKVICPITDPFVRHHGSFGGFVRVHVMAQDLPVDDVASFLRSVPGIDLALTREEACRRFELPEDREGDVAVVAAEGLALGGRSVDHDASKLAGKRLRSHGSIAEQTVPFIVSRPLDEQYAKRAREGLRNFDIFEFAINGTN